MTQTSEAPSRAGAAAPEEVEPGEVLGILASHRGDRGGLISILESVQEKYGYLPEDALRIVSDETGRSLVDVYGIATFYSCFSLQPRGRHLISACLGTACHVRGAARVVKELEHQLGIGAGQTTDDGEFTLATVNCLGACALGPIVVADGHYFCNVKKSDLANILERTRRGLDKTASSADKMPLRLHVSCPRCNHSLMDPATHLDGRASIRVVVGFAGGSAPVNLSSLYASDKSVCPADIPEGASCRFYCPRCHGELAGPSRCGECGAPLAPMVVRGGGMLHLCTRHGCRGHRLDVDGVNT